MYLPPVNIPLPEYTAESDPVISTITLEADDGFIVETVNIFVRIDHSSRGDLRIFITSPSGTTSLIHPAPKPESGDFDMWKFITVKSWGEIAAGSWTLSIEDERAGDLTACQDLDYSVEYEFENGDIESFTCQDLDAAEFCQSGGTDFFGDQVTGPNDQGLTGTDGNTPADACCSCGGGIQTADIVDVLQEWMVVVYGRDTTDPVAPTKMPTNPPTLSPNMNAAITPVPTIMPGAPITMSPSMDMPSKTNSTDAPTDSPTSLPTSSPVMDTGGNNTADTVAPSSAPTSDPGADRTTESGAISLIRKVSFIVSAVTTLFFIDLQNIAIDSCSSCCSCSESAVFLPRIKLL